MSKTDTTVKKQGKGRTTEHLKKYQWVKGESGNPNGRPPGSISPTDEIRKMFARNEVDFHEFLEEYLNDKANRKHVIEMLDGKPSEKIDVTTKGKELPQPLLYAVRDHNRNREGTETEGTDTSDTGRDISG